MTDGLAILTAWLEFALVVGLLVWMLLRRAESDPLREARRLLAHAGTEQVDRVPEEREGASAPEPE